MPSLQPNWPRVLALALLAVLIAPTTWLNSPPPPESGEWQLHASALPAQRPDSWPAGLTLAGAWQITGKTYFFGGYSALLAMPRDRLIAFSDRGNLLELGDPSVKLQPTRAAVVPLDRSILIYPRDIEAATRDPDTGAIWLAYENWNGIRRFDPGLKDGRSVRPAAMSGWPGNGGPESMVRLRDGRFIVLAETASEFSRQPGEGLLFPGDPVEGVAPVSFIFETEGGYQPTDMAQLPDGRVLILLRALRLGLPPFAGRLVVADPDDIRPGEPWRWELFAELDAPLPRENYEGLAVMPAQADPNGTGRATIWVISDDNTAVLQRTLLLKLRWNPDAL